MTRKCRLMLTVVVSVTLAVMNGGRSSGVELITQDDGPYDYQSANWRAGNTIQTLFYGYANLPALSENFIGQRKLATVRQADLYYIGNTGLDLLSYCEEAEYTPVVRLELIKKIFQSMYGSHYEQGDALWLNYSGSKRQVSFLSPYDSGNRYPSSRLLASNLPDTVPEKLTLVWPRVRSEGKWHEDAEYTFADAKVNVYDASNDSYTTEREYLAAGLPGVKICGQGWGGMADKVLQIQIQSAGSAAREAVQLVLSNFNDAGMAFSNPYPTEYPDTVQLPDETETAGKSVEFESPEFSYLIIYTKDADRSGFEYQNALLVGWQDRPDRVTVRWQGSEGQRSEHEAYAGTEGRTDRQRDVHSAGYGEVVFEYRDAGDITKRVWLERFEGVDPSSRLTHLHHIARNIVSRGVVGKKGYVMNESAWLEEPVCALAAGAYILCRYDAEEDRYGGDYADTARAIATRLLTDRRAMYDRGRRSSNLQEYVSGAFFLSRLYELPGRFNNTALRDLYRQWMCEWADRIVADGKLGARDLMAIWRAYELSQKESYKQHFESGRSLWRISEDEGLFLSGQWKNPRDFYSYGDVLGALGRRGTGEDVADIEKLIRYLTREKRWTDTGYMGYWWEVTVENHNYFGRWCKGLGLGEAPKTIVGTEVFPVYYREGDRVVVRTDGQPSFYNPDYWHAESMTLYKRQLPKKIAGSVLFRLENILLKRDYHNGWWKGAEAPTVRHHLESARECFVRIREQIESGAAAANAGELKKQIAEAVAQMGEASRANQQAGAGGSNPNAGDIGHEILICQWNMEYLLSSL